MEDALPPRLRKVLTRICTALWLDDFRSNYVRTPGEAVVWCLLPSPGVRYLP